MQMIRTIPAAPRAFIATKEHRRYVEFAAAVRKSRSIGLCYGPTGIGKTASALRLSRWNALGPRLAPVRIWTPQSDETEDQRRRERLAAACRRTDTVFHTARVGSGWRQLRDELG